MRILKGLPRRMVNRLKVIVCSGMALLFLGTSIFIYARDGYHWVRRVFFFTSALDGTVRGEERYIPRRNSLEGSVEIYLEEWILGPVYYENSRLLPRSTQFSSLLVRNEEIYINFDGNLVISDEGLRPLVDMFTHIHHGLRYNFPRLKEVHVSIDGEPVPRISAKL